MKILLTGGSGFIGKNILYGLGKKYQFFSPTRQRLDIQNYQEVEKYIKEHKIDTIIHSAVVDGDPGLEQNLRMFISLVKNLDMVNKIIQFGSGAEFGKNRDLIKIKESEWGKFIPTDSYGFSKFIIHKIGKNEKKIVNLRLFGIFGQHENYLDKFISNSIVKNLLGLPIKIKQNVIFDYLYVKDLIPVINYFLNNSWNYSDYNVTPNTSISLKEIAKIINSIASKKSRVITVNKDFNFQYTGNNSRLKKNFPDVTFTSYKKAILSLYNFYLKKIKTLDKKSLIKDNYFVLSKIKK